ncbi:MAG TPA: branched-chain amino acid ABC transporter permease, partial [Thauera aminoaromatica]|nr:branched-chain amino acid ABC transporter permease [Thauera aminoaromatica]
MDMSIALILSQDGITNGAIYALLALALVLVFAVTRVIFIQQGEFVAYGALTLAMMQSGVLPATVWMLVAMGALVTVLDGGLALKAGQGRRAASVAGWNLGYPLALAAVVGGLAVNELPLAVQVLLTLAIVVPMGPMMYRLMYQPIASAPVLVLLIVSVALHIAMVGLGLLFFGAEGQRTPAFSEFSLELGPLMVSAQTLWVV